MTVELLPLANASCWLMENSIILREVLLMSKTIRRWQFRQIKILKILLHIKTAEDTHLGSESA
ncbi:hypothetical protein N7533_012044 [Penicillium manginii]|uniref:uncharacterized protein n=1 Tax=Penicillium manginii TaxID=203109 RepID=UPI0025496092|nr:uncharacterized protein N7533_012044 [Penicillium manginii]KAJ5739260.1 hypothetical protein N7533_012044 [Penicillium manginii]